MATRRSSPAKAGSNKVLWAGVAIVVIIVLTMGAALMRIQPQEPRLVALPTAEAPPTHAPPAVAGAATEAVTSATPLPPASTATDPRVGTSEPRIIHPRTSEPAVARAPERVSPQPDTVDDGPLPGVSR